MGLVHPTAKTEGGYWLYDEAAVRKDKNNTNVFYDRLYEK